MCHSRVPRRGLEGSKRTPSHLWSQRSAKANPPQKRMKHWVKDIKIKATSALMSIPLSSSPKWSNLSEIILCIQNMAWSWFYLSWPLTLQLETSHLSTKTSSALLTPSDEAITNLSPLFQLETSPSNWNRHLDICRHLFNKHLFSVNESTNEASKRNSPQSFVVLFLKSFSFSFFFAFFWPHFFVVLVFPFFFSSLFSSLSSFFFPFCSPQFFLVFFLF